MDSENNQEQPAKDSTVNPEQSENNNPDNKPSYEDLEKNFKSLQWEFTKKSQRLSEFEKQGDSIDEAKKKAAEAEYSDKIRAEEDVFNTFKTDFNALSNTQLKAIRDLQSIDTDKSFEEVAKNYWMLNEAQLQRSKNGRQIMGNNIWVKWNEKQEKAVVSERARKRLNIKSPERLAEIKESFGL